MAFYGCPSHFPEKTVPVYDLARVAIVKAFRRILFQDFSFLEAARLQSGVYEGAYLNVGDFTTRSSFKDLVIENPHAIVNFSAYTNRAQVKGDQDESSSEDEEMDRLLEEKEGRIQSETDVRTKRFVTRNAIWPPIGIWAHWILISRVFEFVMIGVILISSALMCIEGETDNANPTWRGLGIVLEGADFFLLLLFLMEIALKWADDFKAFWNEYWNLFDLIVTCASLLTPIFDVAYPESAEDEDLDWLVNTIKYIRIARILRTLNVVTRVHKIMMIWGAITRTFGPLAFITILMLLFFYIFAIIGIQMCDRYTKTHITNLRYVGRFEHIGYACLTLFQIFTIDHWFPILNEVMKVMDPGLACVYFLTWLLLGTFIFKNIFAGVMVNNFQNIRQELVDETNEISNKSKLFRDFAVRIEALEEEMRIPDNQTDWETRVFHLLDLLKVAEGQLSPSLWPRDTLFHYYVILEALGNNISERDELLNILNEGLLHHYMA